VTADTIFALSSGSPPAAVALVRVSGPDAAAALVRLAGHVPPPRTARLRKLRSEGGELLDEAMVIRFEGPQSATGEDIAELHLHGGRAVVAAVLAELARMPGLRAAEPGEFTRRAWENGRLDLTEAEGLADLLAAETESQRRAAQALAGGALTRATEEWQARLLALAAQVEAALDFSDEGEVADGLPVGWYEEVGALAGEIETMLARPSAERLREGVRVVIAGPPNAGKSSLLNYLSGREAAIVAAVPGTTRDLVEAPTAIGGVPFLLIDTAGLRDSADEVETIGVGRARSAVDAADVVLWLGLPGHCPDRSRSIVVASKADLRARLPEAGIDVEVSATTGHGMERLVDLIGERARGLLPQAGEVALNARHRAALAPAAASLREAYGSSDPLLLAECLRASRVALDRLTGRAGVDDMLGALFGRFCIGK
jgi:tRNA modification GTPase